MNNAKKEAARAVSFCVRAVFAGPLFGDLIDFVICAGSDDYDEHFRFGPDQFVDDPKTGSFQLDLEQPGQIGAAFAAQRLAVAAFVGRDGILLDFFDRFGDQKALIPGKGIKIFLRLREKFDAPVHSNSTSSKSARSASEIPYFW